MRAVFLDIDGVIATPTSVRLNYLLGRGPQTQWYDLVALTYLGRLVAQTHARVVLSSNWRHDAAHDDPRTRAIMDNLMAQLREAGAPVYDMTPRLPGNDRSLEVGAWLDDHPCDAYAIIDDLARFDARPDVCAGHLVLVEDSEGFRYRHYRRALELLR